MIPYKPKKPTAVIVHPGNKHFGAGELKVTMQKPSRAARTIYQSALDSQRRYEPAIDPATGKPFLNKSETAVLTLDIQLPFLVEPAVKYLNAIITDIEGFANEAGEPLVMNAQQRREQIEQFAEPEFNLEVMRPIEVFKDGKPTGETEDRMTDFPFMIYLLEKANEEDIFAGPLGRPATTPSSDSSTAS